MNEKVDLEEFDKLDVVRKYFSREFTVLSSEIREKIGLLKIDEKEKKELIKELAFLTKKRQHEILSFLEDLGDN